MSLLAALICVSSYIIVPLPFSPVPLTAQSLAVMLAGSLLSPLQTFVTVMLFILLGTIGLPVFAGGASGPGVLLGPTGGYLVGFLVGAVIISLLKSNTPGILRYWIANLVGGLIVVYAIGVPWLSRVTGMTLDKAFMVGAFPFLPGDLLKVFLAASLACKLAPQFKLQFRRS
ncbi:MAG: biotin transporter BioY [Bacillota bacterium]|nr:biotin transporter BioY [Bacillota bacterium]MDW7676718.1 biotin transporter BioY [Bacillota bacterium]